MEPAGVKETTAYKVIRQMVDHIWGADQDLTEEQIVAICHLFKKRGGSWYSLLDGSMDSAVALEGCIEAVLKYESAHKIAMRIAANIRRVW